MNRHTAGSAAVLARAVRWIVLAVVWLGALGPEASSASTHAQDNPVGTLEPLAGLVQHHHHDTPDDAWNTVGGRETVAEADTIRTGAASYAAVTFFEGVELDILPASVVTVRTLVIDDAEGLVHVSLDMLLGETHHRVEGVLDSGSRYEVRTPAASIVVRGTTFAVRVEQDGTTLVDAVEGSVEVSGLDEVGNVTDTVPLSPGSSVTAQPDGALSPVQENVRPLPPIIPGPLVPVSCGNGVCQPDEAAICPLDCAELGDCGDGLCDPGGLEDPVTCPADCEPDRQINFPPSNIIHFYWGGNRCEILPPAPTVTPPVRIVWGIGCFDSAAHASMHPHPADYMLEIDGRPASMGTLRQTGPHHHDPDCPWGWSYELGPLDLEPGPHRMVLTQTLTDTWSSASMEGESSLAGSVATLSCVITVAPAK